MSEDLAVKIYAVLNNIEDEDQARSLMFKSGAAQEAIFIAESLQPVFQEAFADGIAYGSEIYGTMVRSINADNVTAVSPNFDEGVRAAISAYNKVFDICDETVKEVLDEVHGGGTDPQPEPEVAAKGQPEIMSFKSVEELMAFLAKGV